MERLRGMGPRGMELVAADGDAASDTGTHWRSSQSCSA
jgi:hypothetical protein